MRSTKKIGIVGAVIGMLFLFGTMQSQAQEGFSPSQMEIQRKAELTVAGGMMERALNAALQGRATEPIPREVIDILLKHRAYNQLANFRIAVDQLEGDTGKSLSHLLANAPSPVVSSAIGVLRGREEGWGGFAEFGFFAVSGFIFSMWTAARIAISDMTARPPFEEEEAEEYVEYKKAA